MSRPGNLPTADSNDILEAFPSGDATGDESISDRFSGAVTKIFALHLIKQLQVRVLTQVRSSGLLFFLLAFCVAESSLI